MKPAQFAYYRAESAEHALALLEEYGDEAKVIAGGQSLVPMMAMRLARPSHLIDVSRIKALSGLSIDDDGLTIRASVRQRTAELSAEVSTECPVLAHALGHVAHVAIRTRGTVCGSIAHADPAAEIPLVARLLDAHMTIVSRDGARDVAAADFFKGYLTTAVEPDELLLAVRFPARNPRAGHAFHEVARRRSGDFAIVALGAVVTLDETATVAQCQLAAAGVAGVPVRLSAAEGVLVGEHLDGAVLTEVADAAVTEIDPGSDLHGTAAYRQHLVRALLPGVVAAAARRAVAA